MPKFISKDNTEPTKHIFLNEFNAEVLKGYKIEVKFIYKNLLSVTAKGLKLTMPNLNEKTAIKLFHDLKELQESNK